jgi:hypothetical protein
MVRRTAASALARFVSWLVMSCFSAWQWLVCGWNVGTYPRGILALGILWLRSVVREESCDELRALTYPLDKHEHPD